ncbi:unnamed protein product [Caenorhabditis angaria]|uniref:Arrestin-like N-terminal domain-containing protein n=1 Tax=Caenorhabditis angaria TaxID=860376 RepID=A0A9P1N0G1_9PELO|nr:unnamed protein product [Caenorhabditis angaria]
MLIFLLFLVFIPNIIHCDFDSDQIKYILDNKEEIYKPGDVVSGTLENHYEGDLEIKKIKIDFIGEIRSTNKTCETTDCELLASTIIPLFHETKEFAGKSSKSSKFSFKLPKNSPMSIENFGNWVRYYFNVTIMTNKGIELAPEKRIMVTGGLDLSKDRKYETPGSCKNSGKTISIQAEIAKNGFVSGEDFKVKLTIEAKQKSKIMLIGGSIFALKSAITKTGKNNKMKLTDKPLEISKNTRIFTNRQDTASGLYQGSQKTFGGAGKKDEIEFVIDHDVNAIIPSVPFGTIPIVFVNHVVNIVVELEHDDIFERVTCDIPITIGVVPTKGVTFKTKPVNMRSADGEEFFFDREIIEFYAKYPHIEKP